MDDATEPSGPLFVAALGQLPPTAVRYPNEGAGVVEKKPHACFSSGPLSGLFGCGGECLGMAPVMFKMKGANEVGEEGHKAKRPEA